MTNRNPYDTSIDWLQPQPSSNRPDLLYNPQTQVHTPQPPAKKAVQTKQARMPKQKALEMVDSLKKGIVISSVVSFGVLGLLATGHAVGNTATITKTTTPVTSSSSSSTQTATPVINSGSNSTAQTTTPSNSSSSNSSTNSNSSSNQGGFGFGTSSSQSSSSGTSVS